MKKNEIPFITEKEIIEEISQRTGLPRNSIYSILHTLYDVIQESVACGVEAKLIGLGTFGWKVVNPKKNCVFQNFGRELLPPKDVPGYRLPCLRVKPQWKKDLKEMTEFWSDENKERENSD